MRRLVVSVIALAIVSSVVASCGDDNSHADVTAAGQTTLTTVEPRSPDGFYSAILVSPTGDRDADRDRAQAKADKAVSKGYDSARVLFDNGGPGECVQGPPDDAGQTATACGVPAPGYIVVLDGPFTEQQPLRGQTTAEDENAFRMWHAQKAKDAQDRATRRQLGEDVVVGYFYVAAGEPSS